MADETTAGDLLREALGSESRRLHAIDGDVVHEALGWSCGCRAITTPNGLRSWRACGAHDAFRDGLFGMLATRRNG